MAKGTIYPPEGGPVQGVPWGLELRQVTRHPAVHHHPFFYLPAYDDAMRWLFFVSHRTGAAQIFAEDLVTGRLIQMTDRTDLNEWSFHPSYDGRHVYFTAGTGAWRVDTEGLGEECLADFGDVPMIPPGMVGDAMGTTSLSVDDRWWAVPVRMGRSARLHIIETSTGHCQSIVEAESIGHPQFHSADSNLLHYAGPFHSRLWVVHRDGAGHRLAYRRQGREWIVHEIWNPLEPELLAVNWPRGMIGVDVETGAIRQLTAFPAWHAMIRRDGRRLVCDTTFPDRGLHLIDPSDGAAAFLCPSDSSNAGSHWATDHCPYDDGPVRVYAPQHTHPHPSFSPDGRRVVFTSDRSGCAQIYEMRIAAERHAGVLFG